MAENLLDFSNKTVLVTGGSSGIGRAVSLGFARQGAQVVIGDMNEAGSKETVEMIKKENGQAHFVKTDVGNSQSVKALIEETVRVYGGLDCAFNNAGILHAPQPIADFDEAAFDRVLHIDLKGTFLCLKYELQYMVKKGKGAIVNTASVAGLLPEGGMAAYVAAKHGVIGLTKTAAIENANHGIRVNALAPGWVRTPMTKAWDEDKQFNAKIKAAAPLHRGAEPEEMVGAVLYLCSDAASYTTGQTFPIDGAQTIRGLLPYEG
ncbi:MAG: glucose 1-dehydrogenase [Oligoflexia bacterium]|nr:glucose 1-dehydrogenase [Oligoflexia bacterium]